MATSSRSEHVVTTTKKPKPIRVGVELTIVLHTLLLPIKLVEVPIVVSNIHVEVLEEPIIPKPIPLTLPENGVGAEVTLIDSVTHAFEVLKTLDIVLKDAHIMERLDLQPIALCEPMDTMGELVDDLVVGVKHVVLGD